MAGIGRALPDRDKLKLEHPSVEGVSRPAESGARVVAAAGRILSLSRRLTRPDTVADEAEQLRLPW